MTSAVTITFTSGRDPAVADLITMYDDTNVSVEPSGAPAYAGYCDGRFANLTQLRARFPHARILDIAVFPTDDATCLDVEAGDATIADIFGWFKRQQARKVWRPVVYSSVVNMDHIVATMTANGFPRSSYRLWAAHYQAGQHICGPSTCKLTNAQCDGTQFTNTALSRSLDESILLPGFFDPPAPPPQGPFRHVVPARNTRSLWRTRSSACPGPSWARTTWPCSTPTWRMRPRAWPRTSSALLWARAWSTGPRTSDRRSRRVAAPRS
jgi:hypothetical protein